MKNFAKIIMCGFIVLTMLTLFSCRSTKTIVEKTEVIHSYAKDSIRFSEKVVLDTLFIDQVNTKDSISIQLLKEIGEFKHQKGKATSTIIYKDGVITSDCDCEGEILPYLKELNQSFQSVLKQELNSVKTDSKVKEKNKSNWIQYILIIVLLLSLFINIILWIRK